MRICSLDLVTAVVFGGAVVVVSGGTDEACIFSSTSPNPLLFDFSPSLRLMGAGAAQSPLPQLKEGGIVHRWRPDSGSRSGERERTEGE